MKIKTYKIDDSKVVGKLPKGNFEVYYTLYEDENKNINYQLENLNEEILNVNSLNSYQMEYLHECFSDFNRNIPINNEAIQIFEGENARTIKETFNKRYELYKDMCFERNTTPSNLGYMFTIDKYSKEFEETFNTLVLSDQEGFDDYLEYKILSEIAERYAFQENSFGKLEAYMDSYLYKYKIKENNEIVDKSMYNRLNISFTKAINTKVLREFDKIVEAIPEQYKEKYSKILKYNENKDSSTNYYELSTKKLFLENIEKLENCNSKIKVLVHWAEAYSYYETLDREKNTDNPQVYTLEEMDSRVSKNYIELKEKYGENSGYDKVKFSLILDTGNNLEILDTDRIDVGDPHTETFTEFIKDTYKLEGIEELAEYDDYIKNKFLYLLEENNIEDTSDEEEPEM